MSEKQSKARLRMLREPGHLYAAYSRYCDWIKIGFTSKPVAERIEAINRQYAHFAPFSLIGFTHSTWRAEQQLHRCFSPYRRGRHALTTELYPAVAPLVEEVKFLMGRSEWTPMPRERAGEVTRYSVAQARKTLNTLEAGLSFERFYAERDLQRAERVA